MLAAGHSVLLLSFRSFFFRSLISKVAWPIVIKLCHMLSPRFMVYKIRSKIWVAPIRYAPPPEIWRPKTSKFQRDFAQL